MSELERTFDDAGLPLSDVEDRWRGGLELGDLFKALFILATHNLRSVLGKLNQDL